MAAKSNALDGVIPEGRLLDGGRVGWPGPLQRSSLVNVEVLAVCTSQGDMPRDFNLAQ